MEGTLLLLTAVALQMIIDPSDDVAKVTPFWSSRETAPTRSTTWAPTTWSAARARLGGHVVMLALVAVVSSVRVRRRSHLRQA